MRAAVDRLQSQWRDPLVRAVVVALVLVASGFVVLVAAAMRMRGHRLIVLQLPYAVSGAFGGMALVGFGLGYLSVQLSRRLAATSRTEFDELLEEIVDLARTCRPGASEERLAP